MAASLCLTSRIPIVLYWGPGFTVLYNDPYISFLGENKHPKVLGRPGRECWSEIWPTIGPMLESVRLTAEATWSEDLLMFFARRLPLEEVYVRFSFGPVLAADGVRVDGIFCPCTETTEQVVSARRMSILGKLGMRPWEAQTVRAACEEAARVLAENPQDIPFAAVYLLDGGGLEARLAAEVHLPNPLDSVPPRVSLSGSNGDWPFSRVAATRRAEELSDLQTLGRFTGPLWPERVERALVLPLLAPGHEKLSGLMIAGVSPRRVLDAAYREFFDLVAGHVAAAITNAQAYEEERERVEALARLDRAKTAFFSNISHEFRTPLTLILGPAEQLLGGTLGETTELQRAHLTTLRNNAMRLERLVNALLDFARVEAGRIEAHYEPLDLGLLTRDLASTFCSAVHRAGLLFIVNCPSLDEPVYVDRDMWEKIVLNLLSNALKFTFKGFIEVSLAAAGAEVTLCVRDSGVGIPKEELPRLFDRFHRVQGARARTQEGSGIGLALVQELVKLHGGTIRVESEPGAGSLFTVVLPKGAAHLPKERVGASPAPVPTALAAAPFVEEALSWLPEGNAPATVESPLDATVVAEAQPFYAPGSERILVVDDNSDMRDYLRRLLEPHWRVGAAHDGAEALAAAKAEPPDLVIADVMMPGLNGFELLAALRAEPRTMTVPVVLLSARAGEEAHVEGMNAGADDYVVKPFGARELLARVKARLDIARVRREAEEKLERTVAERTRELQQANMALLRDMEERKKLQEQLLQAQKMESIGVLAGGIAHDFNNILNIIQAYGFLLRDAGAQDDKAREGLTVIQKTVQRGSALVQQLLTLGRRSSAELEPVNANALVEGLMALMRQAFPKTIELSSFFEADLPPILADRNQIEQALLNLGVNARDAMPQGGELNFKTRTVDGKALQRLGGKVGERYVSIEVRDSGAGMEEEVRNRIFEPFFTTKDKGQGTGLGLSVVYGIVKSHHGLIEVESQPGAGSAFRLYFPAAPAGEPAEEAAAKGKGEAAKASPVRAAVLIVEDERIMLQVLETILSERGHRVFKAYDGEMALDLYRQHKDEIEVVLLDMGLPKLGGREVLQRLRGESPDLKIVITSGYLEPESRLQIDWSGVRFLHKPYMLDEVVKTIQSLVEKPS
jgi:signal transduction histidine kinase